MSDSAPKSAYELAMERLRRKDAEEGAAERPLTDHQKADIAEARQVHAARTAELELMHQSRLRSSWDPAEHERLEADYRQELRRLTQERDTKIERIRAGS